MVKISLIPSDGIAVVDGDSRNISFAGIDPTIHAVQFNTVKGAGHVEIVDGDNINITDLTSFQIFLDRWTAAAPPPPPPPTPEELAREVRRAVFVTEAADTFIDNLRGATPQQIKDFVQSNVTDLASAKVLIGKLAVAVAYSLAGGSDK